MLLIDNTYTEMDLLLHKRRLNIEETNEQAWLDIRRFLIIVNDFWIHQFRRENGDMTVGDIVLPWAKVQGEWFESNN